MRAESQEKEKGSRDPGFERGNDWRSASELRLEHIDYRMLLGDDLGLPNQRDGHQAHGEDAQSENQSHLCF
jgi:hypothetical protein